MLCANFSRYYDISCECRFLSDALDLACRSTNERLEVDFDVPWIPTGKTIRRDEGDNIRVDFANRSADIGVEKQQSQKASDFDS